MVPSPSTISEFVVSALTHVAGWFAGGTLAWASLGLGGALAAWAGVKLLMNSRVPWVPVTGCLTGCSVESVPVLFRRTRRIVQVTYVYHYVAGGQRHEGTQTVIEKQDGYYDPRKRARTTMAGGQIEVCYDERRPSRSCLRKPARQRARAALFTRLDLARNRTFYGFRLIPSAKLAFCTGLIVVLISAAALIKGTSGSKPASVARDSNTLTRHNLAPAVRERDSLKASLRKPGTYPRATTTVTASGSPLASRGQ